MPAPATALDASFLYAETPSTPMHVGAILVVEPEGEALTTAALRRRMRHAVSVLPRFRQRAAAAPLGLRRPSWVEMEPDLSEHVIGHQVQAGGGWSEALEVVARIHEGRLDRDRPLWEIHLVSGLRGRRQLVVTKTHHAITDGLGGLRIAEAMMDPGAVRPEQAQTVLAGRRAAASGAALGSAWLLAGGPVARPGPFNGGVRPARSLATAKLPVAGILAAKATSGCRWDDVLLATVTLAAGRYLRSRRRQAPDRLRAMVPVSLRGRGQGGAPGNLVSATFVDLPVSGLDGPATLAAIASAKREVRSVHEAAGLAALIEVVGLLPAPLHALGVRLVAGLPVCHLIVSDLPGPERDYSLLGHRVSAVYPLMPLMADVGLSVAAFRSGTEVDVGITADPGLVPRLDRLAAGLGPALEALTGATRAA